MSPAGMGKPYSILLRFSTFLSPDEDSISIRWLICSLLNSTLSPGL